MKPGNSDKRTSTASRVYRWMFLAAALHNVVGGLGFVFFYEWVYTHFGATPPQPGIHYQMWIALIFVFGLAYWLIYRDMFASRRLLIVSILAKFATAGVLAYALLVQTPGVPGMFWVTVGSDGLWGVLFGCFFWYASTNELWGDCEPRSEE